ncbi:hypothetical protein NBM05_08355 [Rothia sp. AR01]|uniref:Uncharacterized protein n=1 Tax=Rothia santali TaxID=2949643 RepID=A0A9X2HE33_9MICC|nr:hypothetical protein [Rothia santali]MCP3426012.1 hypothetical protein [Rothia santali]
MTIHELLIPQNGIPWINSNDRGHWSLRHDYTRLWRAQARTRAARTDLVIDLNRVRIDASVFKARANRYDPANLYPTAKAVVDGLVDYGLVVDDDWRHVEGPFLHHGGISAAPGLLLRIEEL